MLTSWGDSMGLNERDMIIEKLSKLGIAISTKEKSVVFHINHIVGTDREETSRCNEAINSLDLLQEVDVTCKVE